jgi:hypothetical protein
MRNIAIYGNKRARNNILFATFIKPGKKIIGGIKLN